MCNKINICITGKETTSSHEVNFAYHCQSTIPPHIFLLRLFIVFSLAQLRSRNLERFEEDCTALVVDKYNIGSFLACATPSGMIYDIPEIDEKFVEENFEDQQF